MFSYRRKQSSFSTLGMAKLQSPSSAQVDNRASTSVMQELLTPTQGLLPSRTGLNISPRRFFCRAAANKCSEKDSLYALGIAAFPASSPSNWEKKGSNWHCIFFYQILLKNIDAIKQRKAKE